MASKRSKPARLVATVEHHEPEMQVSPGGELQTVQRADVTVHDRSSGQTVREKAVLDVPHTLRHWT